MPVFVPRERKHKVRRRLEDENDHSDSNVVELLPANTTEKEQKRQELSNALRAGYVHLGGLNLISVPRCHERR